MNADSRLNILLTHGLSSNAAPAEALESRQPWYRSLSTLLAPMGVRTFEATTGPDAMAVIEKNPIHLAVVDTRLTGTDELSLPKLIQRFRERTPGPTQSAPQGYRVQVKFEQKETRQQIEVRFEASAAEWPAVILLTPARNDQMLAEALKFNVFSVVNEPVDVNLMLEIMARAMRRFHQNQWPQ